MGQDTKHAQAQLAYKQIREMLEEHDWEYDAQEEEMRIDCSARGDDLLIDLIIFVDAERYLAIITSPLSYIISEKKRAEIAVAVTVINSSLANGALDFDVSTGRLSFRMCSSYQDSMLSKEAYHYMLLTTCHTVDDFNDKLFMLNKGVIDLKKFVELYRQN